MSRELLEGVDKLGGVPAVSGGVGDVDGHGHGELALLLRGLAVGDHGEHVGLTASCHMGGVGLEVHPGDAGDAVEVPGLTGLGLDAVVAAVGGHVLLDGPVEGGKVLIVLCPEVGEGVVILMEDGVVGVDHVMGAGVPLLVHCHAEGGVGQDVVGDTPDEAGVELQPILIQHGFEAGHIQADVHGVAHGQDVAVVIEMFPAGPGGEIDGGKHRGCLLTV